MNSPYFDITQTAMTQYLVDASRLLDLMYRFNTIKGMPRQQNEQRQQARMAHMKKLSNAYLKTLDVDRIKQLLTKMEND